MKNLDWNDLRFVVAISRGGSALAAAKTLSVSHATVLRRIQALEDSMGTALFDRLSTGYVPTDVGRMLGEVGMSIENVLTDTGRLIDARATELAGTVRFTTTDSLAYFLMPPILASFRERHPQIVVDMLVTNSHLDLNKRDADITLRPSGNPPESWVGKRLGRVDYGIYATSAYLSIKAGVPWQALDWLMPAGPLADSPAARWLRPQIERPPVLCIDSFVGLRSLVLNNMGAAILPFLMAHGTPELSLIQSAPSAASVDLWVLTHPYLRQSARIRAFMEHLSVELRAFQWKLAAPNRDV
ncbi:MULTISPECIES: LysR family transcriptional regulator [Burkholderia cepacia complex]|uniref:LysR family transcriptional regulator n=1 Tax=Burkholderia cepacia complex TaxID=87882 RepID=UPI001CF1D3E9|nr:MULTISPECIES: LysR family transcriptional regulator [Burkholderia cepacia complex]MCA8057337.1 LysR family transcriptional regulator [Burkholderia cepacia]MDN7531322.1 LysR family transcriptional regulator [Burkholderia orbicola]